MGTCADGVTIRVRNESRRLTTLPFGTIGVDQLKGIRPVRSLAWYAGQRSFPGWYWSATMAGHVQYDSRLELSRLLLADFDPSVEVIVAQPFQIAESVDRAVVRRQIPDYLLLHSDRTVTIVNVKTPEALADDTVRSTFEWVSAVVAAHGWRHEVWSGGDTTLLANVRFLAGFRRPHHRGDLLRLIAQLAPGHTVAEIGAVLGTQCYRGEVRPAAFHLLWWHVLRAALDEPLSANTVLKGPSCA